MAKARKKLSAAQKRAKRERKKQFETVFMNGKQVRVRREPTIDGIPVDQFIEENADPLWLHQHGMWEFMPQEEPLDAAPPSAASGPADEDDEIPF